MRSAASFVTIDIDVLALLHVRRREKCAPVMMPRRLQQNYVHSRKSYLLPAINPGLHPRRISLEHHAWPLRDIYNRVIAAAASPRLYTPVRLISPARTPAIPYPGYSTANPRRPLSARHPLKTILRTASANTLPPPSDVG